MQGVTFCNLNLKFNIVLWIEFRKNYSRNLLSTWATQICPWEITSGMQLFNVLFCEMYVYTLCLQSHGNGEGCSTAVGVFFFLNKQAFIYGCIQKSWAKKCFVCDGHGQFVMFFFLLQSYVMINWRSSRFGSLKTSITGLDEPWFVSSPKLGFQTEIKLRFDMPVWEGGGQVLTCQDTCVLTRNAWTLAISAHVLFLGCEQEARFWLNSLDVNGQFKFFHWVIFVCFQIV